MQYLYLLKVGQQHYKVGISSNVSSRAHGLQLHNPELIQIVVTKLVDKPYDAEQEIHKTLGAMKADGANEWFILTPEQALEVAIAINKYPDLDVSQKVTLNGIVRQQQRLLKIVERKLDYVINTYQKRQPAKDDEPTERIPNEVQFVEPQPAQPPIPDKNEQDSLDVERALVVIQSAHKISTSLLQRKLSIGYGRAARIIDKLEQMGIVSPLDGIHREVLHVPQTISKVP